MPNLLAPMYISPKLSLQSRVAMSSLTRNRCVDDFKPGPSHVQYYTDRARHGTGLIVTEGTLIDWSGILFPYAPFMINDDHAEAWSKVVESVHQEGCKIFMQAWHPGRVQNENMCIAKEKDVQVVAPSCIPAQGGLYRDLPGTPGHTKNVTAIEDPAAFVESYRMSAVLAKGAGFDGIEILGQGGYLPHQFLNSRSNQRSDAYGGSVANRCRFLLEVADAISEVFGGHDSICVKISPADVLNDSVADFAEVKETYAYLIKELVKRRVGIICISRRGHNLDWKPKNETVPLSRPAEYPLPPNYDPVLDFGHLVKFHGSPTKLMVNEDYTIEEGESLVEQDKADLVSFGRPFIYNPDLVARIKNGTALAGNDRDGTIFYGPYDTVDQGYNDWPTAKA